MGIDVARLAIGLACEQVLVMLAYPVLAVVLDAEPCRLRMYRVVGLLLCHGLAGALVSSLAAPDVSGLLSERVSVFALALGTFGLTRALCRWFGDSAALVVSALALGVLVAPAFVESYANQCGGVAPGVRTAVLALNPLLAGSSARVDLLHLPTVYEVLPIAVREFHQVSWYCTALGWAVAGGLCWLGSETVSLLKGSYHEI